MSAPFQLLHAAIAAAPRRMLAGAVLVALALAGCKGGSDGADGAAGPAGPAGPPANASGVAKHVILIIGDGMNLNHEIAGSRYLTGKDMGLAMHQFPYRGFATTWDVTTYNKYAGAATAAFVEDFFFAGTGYDQRVGGAEASQLIYAGSDADAYFLTKRSGKEPATDSASAGTAMACGRKTDDGNVCWKAGDPADGRISHIAELARTQLRARFGIVSTVPWTHATPACFAAHNDSRNNYWKTAAGSKQTMPIDAEIATVVKPDVVIGGGHPAFDGKDPDEYVAAATIAALKADPAYVFVERQAGKSTAGADLLSAADQAAVSGRKLFGCYGGPGGNFVPYNVADVPGAPACTKGTNEEPTLADAAEAALRTLRGNDGGASPFFLMIEQGDIDWAR